MSLIELPWWLRRTGNAHPEVVGGETLRVVRVNQDVCERSAVDKTLRFTENSTQHFIPWRALMQNGSDSHLNEFHQSLPCTAHVRCRRRVEAPLNLQRGDVARNMVLVKLSERLS